MNRKEKKLFETLKREMLINLLNKESRKIPLPIFIKLELQFRGFGLMTHDLREKLKLTYDDNLYQVDGMGVSK